MWAGSVLILIAFVWLLAHHWPGGIVRDGPEAPSGWFPLCEREQHVWAEPFAPRLC